MNLRLRRLVRTPYSEQFTLYREENEEIRTVGKLDLHFTEDGVYGTFLFWDTDAQSWEEEQLRDFVEGLISDLCEPAGMPEAYVIEYFVPQLESYQYFTPEEEMD